MVSRLSIFLGAIPTAIPKAPGFTTEVTAATETPSSLLGGGASANLVLSVVEWARRRNAHRLALVAGKQACLEGWRHLVEIGLRMLHFLARASPDALALTSVGGGGATPTIVNRCLYGATMTLLNPLLYEVGRLGDLIHARAL